MRAGGRASGCGSRGISLCHCPYREYITALSIQHLGDVRMTIDPDRKTYWDLFETLTWIVTRDERRAAALRDCSDQQKMALALWGMNVRMVIHSLQGLGERIAARIWKHLHHRATREHRILWMTCSQRSRAVVLV